MNIMDKATGKIYEIQNYDGDIGDPDYMEDIIGNSGNEGITCDRDSEQYISDMDTIQFWLDYVDGMRDAIKKEITLLDALSDIDSDVIDVEDYAESIAMSIGNARNCDYDQHASASIMAMRDWIRTHVSSDHQDMLLALLD